MKRVMVTKEKELFEKRIRDEENDFYRRRAQRDEIDHGKRQFLQMKIESKKMIEHQQKSNYQMLIEERHQKINRINENCAKLEDVERLLVEKLGVTQMNQHQALANLHKVVQICNSGIVLPKKHGHLPQLQQNLNTDSSQLYHQSPSPAKTLEPMSALSPDNMVGMKQTLNKNSTSHVFDESVMQLREVPQEEQQPPPPQEKQEQEGESMMITAVDPDVAEMKSPRNNM